MRQWVIVRSGLPTLPGAPRRSTRRLLVADDTDDILVLLRIILGSAFEIIAEATDGEQALDQWQAHRDDVFAQLASHPALAA